MIKNKLLIEYPISIIIFFIVLGIAINITLTILTMQSVNMGGALEREIANMKTEVQVLQKTFSSEVSIEPNTENQVSIIVSSNTDIIKVSEASQ